VPKNNLQILAVDQIINKTFDQVTTFLAFDRKIRSSEKIKWNLINWPPVKSFRINKHIYTKIKYFFKKKVVAHWSRKRIFKVNYYFCLTTGKLHHNVSRHKFFLSKIPRFYLLDGGFPITLKYKYLLRNCKF